MGEGVVYDYFVMIQGTVITHVFEVDVREQNSLTNLLYLKKFL